MRGDNRGETLVNGEHRGPLWCLVLLADVGYWKFTQAALQAAGLPLRPVFGTLSQFWDKLWSRRHTLNPFICLFE